MEAETTTSVNTGKDLSGVAWTGGSLVGSLNPINHGFRTADGKGGYIINNTHKRYKRTRRDADGNVITATKFKRSKKIQLKVHGVKFCRINSIRL